MNFPLPLLLFLFVLLCILIRVNFQFLFRLPNLSPIVGCQDGGISTGDILLIDAN